MSETQVEVPDVKQESTTVASEVKQPIDHHWVAVHRWPVQIAVAIFPSHIQLADISRVDLVRLRILNSLLVASVNGPVPQIVKTVERRFRWPGTSCPCESEKHISVSDTSARYERNNELI